MRRSDPQNETANVEFRRLLRWSWSLLAILALILIVGLRHARRSGQPAAESGPSADAGLTRTSSDSARAAEAGTRSRRFPSAPLGPVLTAEQIVSGKVVQFGRNRRELVRAIARRSQKQVPPAVEKFFDAVESGHWEDIKAQWEALAPHSGQFGSSTNNWDELSSYWPSVLDAYGVAEQAHLWPAQKLLDYGNAILDSLKPGMVYVGGTDNGRWIPELLNETSDGEQHIIVTQNALADGRYGEFVSELYGDRLATLTGEDSQRIFQEYIADAQKRLQHDQQYPNEPRQLREGEDIQVVDGKAQVGGQVAVMCINEKLLQALMQKNPDLSFAIQESYPFKSTYADALPLGPLMELGARNDQNSFTAETADQSANYWRAATQQILADPEATASETALKAYSHDAVTAAHLLAAHNFSTEAEETYRLGSQLWPDNPEPVLGLADLLAAGGRTKEAQQLVEDFSQTHPDERKAFEQRSALWKFSVSN